MSLIAVLLSLLIFVDSGFGADPEVEVDSGQDVTLPCRGPSHEEITLLEWSKPDLSADEYLLFLRNKRAFEKHQHSSFRGRVELRDPSMRDGDAAVILRQARVSDAGTYECLVTSSSTGSSDSGLSETKQSVRLRVRDTGFIEGGGNNGGGGGGAWNGGPQRGSLSSAAALVVPCVFFLLL